MPLCGNTAKLDSPTFWDYQGSSKVDVQCESLSTTKGSVPGHPFPYSDHEALTAELRLEPVSQTQAGDDQGAMEPDCTAGTLLWPSVLSFSKGTRGAPGGSAGLMRQPQ